MLKYRCLVLDHDDTVVQSMKTMSYPFWCMELEIFRPGRTMTFEEYVMECHNRGFAGLCRDLFRFTEEELKQEHSMWMDYVMTHTPDPYPGIPMQTTFSGTIGPILTWNRMPSTVGNCRHISENPVPIPCWISCSGII